MRIHNDCIYFSIVTHTNFRQEYELTYDVINNVAFFFQSHTDIPLMFGYVDNKGIKTNKITEKNKEKVHQKLKEKNLYQFTIAEYITQKEFYDTSGNRKKTSDISFSIDLLERQTKHFGISVAIPTEFMSERKKITDFCSLFKELNELVHGFNSFISRGTCYPAWFVPQRVSIFDYMRFSNENTWDKWVRGYYWGCVLNDNIVEKIGGIERIENKGFYKVEKWGDCIYVQVTDDLLEYSLDDAIRMRSLLNPAFPPRGMKVGLYDDEDDYFEAKSRNVEFFMIKEDLIRKTKLYDEEK